jgi:hypothetical protein
LGGESNRPHRQALGVEEFVERFKIRDQPGELGKAAVDPERIEDLLRHFEAVHLSGLCPDPISLR